MLALRTNNLLFLSSTNFQDILLYKATWRSKCTSSLTLFGPIAVSFQWNGSVQNRGHSWSTRVEMHFALVLMKLSVQLNVHRTKPKRNLMAQRSLDLDIRNSHEKNPANSSERQSRRALGSSHKSNTLGNSSSLRS